MLNRNEYSVFESILRSELVPALGCTEPIAIAYAAATARDVLGATPERCTVSCSGNMIKNVLGVTVPNSEGAKGIQAAAILGIVAGKADKELAVLEGAGPEDCRRMRELLAGGFCDVRHVQNVANLYILIELSGGGHTAAVEISGTHTNITKIVKDGAALKDAHASLSADDGGVEGRELLSVEKILEFADTADISSLGELFERQIECNLALADEGISGEYGAQVGRTIAGCDSSIGGKIRSAAAAASDARMNGCSLPAIINSGSGNQGITASVPLAIYARENGIGRERLIRGLIVSNLTVIHQKKYIGSLSAYCGAVCAACGAACGIAYLQGCGLDVISRTIINTIGTIGGMVCDGAKSSCAAKIAAALSVSLTALDMAKEGRSFMPGEGMVKSDVEKTIQSIGRMGRDGMHQTDNEIISIMLDSQ